MIDRRRQLYKVRRRQGRIVLRVEVDKEAISMGLYRSGYLPLDDIEDARAINAAFERYAVAVFDPED